jgi:hypothetical protein
MNYFISALSNPRPRDLLINARNGTSLPLEFIAVPNEYCRLYWGVVVSEIPMICHWPEHT